MFRCQMCQTVAPKGTRAQKVIITTRPKTYAAQESESTRFRRAPRNFRERSAPPRDRGGEGREIVQEIAVCPKCAERHALQTASRHQSAAQSSVPSEPHE